MRDSMGTSAFVFQGGDRLSESKCSITTRISKAGKCEKMICSQQKLRVSFLLLLTAFVGQSPALFDV